MTTPQAKNTCLHGAPGSPHLEAKGITFGTNAAQNVAQHSSGNFASVPQSCCCFKLARFLVIRYLSHPISAHILGG